MFGVNARRLLLNATVLSLALGVSVFASAQDTPQSGGASTASSGKMTKKSNKKSGAAASSDQAADQSAGASSGLKGADKTFVMKAAQGGLAEVQLGQMAAQKGNSDAVKQFGQKMVDDHSKANDELKSLAQQKNVTLPTEPDAASKAMATRLEKLSGDQFDRAYMSHMVKDHTKDVAEFKKEGSSGKDPDVKAWAEKTTPTLEGHLKMAKETNAKEHSEKGSAAKSDKSSK